jgi:hypothetical protein
MVGSYITYGEKRDAYSGMVGKPEGKRPLGRITLRRIFKKWDGEAWTGLIWLWIGTGGGFL